MNATTTKPSTPAAAAPKREVRPLNGVDTPTLFATIGAVRETPELARFRFRATNRWQQGTFSRTRIQSFFGAGEERMHRQEFVFDADHPEVLTGRDNGALPVEYLLVGLTSCIMAGIGNIAAARGVTLYEVEANIEGEIDLQGILGLSSEVRNGYKGLQVDFKIKGDAPDEMLRKIVEQGRDRSAVYETLVNGTSVAVTVNGK